MPPVASDFWEAVENLLDERIHGIGSRRALATRLHELDQRQTAESWLRSLKRYGGGSIPSEETAMLIAQAFDVSRDQLPEVERLSLKSLDLRLRVAEAKAAVAEEFFSARLRELADKLADAETALASLKKRHDRLQARVRKLEGAHHEPGATAAKGLSR